MQVRRGGVAVGPALLLLLLLLLALHPPRLFLVRVGDEGGPALLGRGHDRRVQLG